MGGWVNVGIGEGVGAVMYAEEAEAAVEDEDAAAPKSVAATVELLLGRPPRRDFLSLNHEGPWPSLPPPVDQQFAARCPRPLQFVHLAGV